MVPLRVYILIASGSLLIRFSFQVRCNGLYNYYALGNLNFDSLHVSVLCMCIMYTCRVRSVVNMLPRVLKEDAVIHGYHVPAGVSQSRLIIYLFIFNTCR